MKVYAVYINGDNDGEFATRSEAIDYIEHYIKGSMETYHKTRSYICRHNEIKIEVIEYD